MADRNHAWLVIWEDLKESFNIVTSMNFPLLGRLMENWRRNYKAWEDRVFKWTEKSRERLEQAVATGTASWYFDTTPRDLVVDSTTALKANYLLRFEAANKARKWDLFLEVVEVVDATTVKCIKVWGTDVALIATDRAVMAWKAVEEWSDVWGAEEIRLVTKKSNNFQILDWTLKSTRSFEGSNVQSNVWKMSTQIADAMQFDISRMYTETFSNWVKAERTLDNWVVKYFAWGIRTFFWDPIAWWGVAITKTKLNDAIQQIVDWGWRPELIRCWSDQSRAISALDADKVTINLWDNQRWEVVTSFKSDIAIPWGSSVLRVEIDYQMAPDEIEILSIDDIAIVPYSNWELRVSDATLPWADYVKVRFLAEYTVVVNNWTKTQARINNLLF